MKKQLTIQIQDLSFKCIIGILDFERVTKQRVLINITITYTYENHYFINYAQVATLVKKIMKKKKFELLEDAIIYIEHKLYKLYKIDKLKIKIAKPDILKDCMVSLSN